MAVWIWGIVFFVISGMISGIVIFFALQQTKDIKKKDVPPNKPLFLNPTRTKFTDGYFLGVIKDKTPNKNGTELIEYYPFDIEQGSYLMKIPDVKSVVVKKEYLKPVSYSSRRQIIEALGRHITDYPEEIRNTIKGGYYSEQGQLAYLESQFKSAIPNGDKAIEKMMQNYARGNMTEEQQKQIEQHLNMLLKIQGQGENRNEKRENN